MTLPIRARLTLWYAAALVCVLMAFSAGVLALQNRFSRSQFDEELQTLAAAVSASVRAGLADGHGLARAAAGTREDFNVPNRTIAILDGSGRPVTARWRGFHRESLPAPSERALAGTVVQDGQPWRWRLERQRSAAEPFTIFTAASEGATRREQHLLAKALLVGMPAAIVFAALVGWWAASRALRPLTTMSREAEQITLQSLDTRLTSAADDEIGQLRRAFNLLLTRVADGVATQRRFMADASHELRTPIAAVRTAAEITLSQPRRNDEEYRDALGIVLVQTDRLERMVERMLMLARADAGGYQLRRQECSLSDAIQECVDTAQMLASRKRIALLSEVEPDVISCADEGLLRQLALNLLENAIKHTPAGGRVTAALRVVGGRVELAVADTGCGIPWAERERIFERFVRLDEARSDDSGGAGLGLSIARWIAESHHGTLTLERSSPSGSTFVARLPLAPPGRHTGGRLRTPTVSPLPLFQSTSRSR